jgi:ABC-type branched-subunit amino acid transport system substrate-binding protein
MKKMFLSYLAVLMTIIALAGFSSCSSSGNNTTEGQNGHSNDGTSEDQEILIGALLSLTGELAEKGQADLAAIQLAITDFNDYLEEQSAGKTVRLVYADDATIPSVAMEKIDDLAAQGVKLVVGPMTSEMRRGSDQAK